MSSMLDARLGPAAARADLADIWLDKALGHLVEAYREEAPRPERVEASRLAVVFSALAVEARLNHVLRDHDRAEWPAIATLAPAEKFRLAPRLLGEPESMWANRPLLDHAVRLFELRDDLVFGGTRNETVSRFNPGTARAMVEAGAEICCFLAVLAGDTAGQAAGRSVRESAKALHAETPPAVLGLEPDDEFPPDVVGS